MLYKKTFKTKLLSSFLLFFVIIWTLNFIFLYITLKNSINKTIENYTNQIKKSSDIYIENIINNNEQAIKKEVLHNISDLFSGILLNYGNKTLTILKDNKNNKNTLFSLFINQTEYTIDIKDSYNTVWGTFFISFNTRAIEHFILKPFQEFIFFNFGIFFIYIGILMVLIKNNEKPIVKLVEYVSSFKNTDKSTHYNLLKKNINLEVFEWNSLFFEFKQAIQNILTLENKLKEMQKLAAIGKTTAMLAHDIRKPFSAVGILLDSLDNLRNKPNEIENHKKEIKKYINNVEIMINDLMDFSREMKLETEASSLIGVIDFSIRQSILAKKDATSCFIYSINHTYQALIDVERLARAFTNIISNAIEAMEKNKDKKIIKISTYNDNENNIVITIYNNGPMFTPNEITHLFETFFTNKKKKGTGLGLAAAKKITLLHGGDITAYNIDEPAGVEFKITLPSTLIPEKKYEYKLIQNGRKILTNIDLKQELQIPNTLNISESNVVILDDEILYRAFVRRLIKNNKHLDKKINLYETQSVKDTLELIKNEKISHAIIDIDLNDMQNGYDLLSKIKTENIDIKCLVHSNRNIKEDIEKAKKLGAVGFVSKPLNINNLLSFLSSQNTNISYKYPKSTMLIDDTSLVLNHLENLIKKIYPKSKILKFTKPEPAFDILLKDYDEKQNIQLVICDNDFGKDAITEGTEFVEMIRQFNTSLKVFLCSHTPEIILSELAKECGANGSFSPTIEVNELKNIIDF